MAFVSVPFKRPTNSKSPWLVEPSVPTILPQDVVDVKAIGFELR
jgi:hypothetical protein